MSESDLSIQIRIRNFRQNHLKSTITAASQKYDVKINTWQAWESLSRSLNPKATPQFLAMYHDMLEYERSE